MSLIIDPTGLRLGQGLIFEKGLGTFGGLTIIIGSEVTEQILFAGSGGMLIAAYIADVQFAGSGSMRVTVTQALAASVNFSGAGGKAGI